MDTFHPDPADADAALGRASAAPRTDAHDAATGRVPVTLPTAPSPPPELVQDIRSDQAGETGAVRIYQGILAVSRNERVRTFAGHHLATEREHLRLIDACFPRRLRSRLLPLWNIAGFLTGLLPALIGPRAVYATIAAVETFVDHHYQEQVDRIDAMLADGRDGGALAAWRTLLLHCQADEVAHRDEAQALVRGPLPWWLAAWRAAVGRGSAIAVTFARRF